MRFLIVILLIFTACQTVEETSDPVLTEVPEASMYETVPEAAAQLKPAADWVLLVQLKRNNRSPERFNVIDEDIDPLTEAYVAGKDFLFVVGWDHSVTRSYYYFDQPAPPELPRFDIHGQALPGVSAVQIWHFTDTDAWWFQWFLRVVSEKDKAHAGFGVDWDVTPVTGNKPDRKYLSGPTIGASVEHLYAVGFSAPEIENENIWLRIYVR